MQQITDVIASAQGGEAIPNLGRAFGLSTQQTEAVLAEVLPALVRGIERNTLSRGGLADLVKALGAGHHEAVLERPEAWGDRRVQQDGHGILGHILGSEGRALGLAVQTSRATGISDSIIQMLLPILAQMLMGAISRWLKGGLGDIAGRLPGGDGGGGGMPFSMPGGGRSGGGREPNYGPGFELPKVWWDRKDKLDLKTPFNFVSTADIIGGNSGSPVINKKGEVVGLIFDGNIQSLVLDLAYTEEQGRSVSVDSRAMIEAMKKIYDAGAMADEILKR